jgi:putative radical SAM enzyme (TIGR03279 family)
MPILRELADAGIRLKAQIVLCKGINDGEILLKSLQDLRSLHPALTSVSVVPVGLTKFREGLEPLEPFTGEDSAQVLDMIEDFTDKCLKELGTRLIYPSDEFFLSANRPLPTAEYYEDFEQIENGVGMLARYKENLDELMEELKKEPINKKISMITGFAAATFFKDTVVPAFKEKLEGLDCTVYPVRNDFFGEKITVAGLVTGQDVIAQLKGKDLGEALIVPTVMLRDDAFLDDVTVSDIETELGVKVIKSGPEPCDLYEVITGNTSPIQQ